MKTTTETENETIALPATSTLPSWIEPALFEPVFRKICADFKQIKTFNGKQALAAGENYMAVMLRLQAELELKDGSSKTISLMLKTAHDHEISREMMKSHNVFDVEINVYREVVPEFEKLYKEAGLEVRFGAKSYELETEHPYILLEDLSLRDFKNMNRIDGLDIEHSQAVLKKLAQWHAASAVRVAAKGPYKSILKDGFFSGGPERMETMRPMFDSMGKIFLDCAKSYEGNETYFEALRKAQSRCVDDIFAAIAEEENDFCVLNHGDCWSNNVMFQHDDNGRVQETYLVDYQIPKYGSPAIDLYYFLLTSTKYELKLTHFDNFVRYYHEQLLENLLLLKYTKKMPSLKDLHIMLFKYGIWAYYTITGVMAAVLLDPSENASMENFIGESDAGKLFKYQLYSNPRYCKHMQMILPWLYSRGCF